MMGRSLSTSNGVEFVVPIFMSSFEVCTSGNRKFRLAHTDGLGPVSFSYEKKHPLTGETLPVAMVGLLKAFLCTSAQMH